MPHLLLIDSDAAFVHTAAGRLQAAGFEVTTAGDGQAGLESARRHRPDAIVLAVELPEVSGFTVCSRLRRSVDLAEVPLVMVSSEASEEAFEQHRKNKARADAYLRKPLEAEALLREVRALVGGEAEVGGAAAPAVGAEVVDFASVAGSLGLVPDLPGPPPLPRDEGTLDLLDELPDPFEGLGQLRIPQGASPEERLEALREHVRRLEGAVHRGREVWDRVRSAQARLRGDAEAREARRGQVDERLEALESELADEREAREELEGQVMEARGEAALREEEVNGLLATVAQLEDEVVEKGRSHAAAMEDAERARREISEVLDEALAEREAEARTAAARVAGAEARMREAEAALAAEREAARGREESLRDEAEARVAAAREEAAGARDEALEALRREHAEALEALRREHAEALAAARAEGRARAEALEGELEAVRRERAEAASEAEAGSEDRARLERSLAEARGEAEGREAELADLRRRLAEAESELEELREENAFLDGEVSRLSGM